MKKRNGIIIASVAHIISWVVALAASIIGRLAFHGDPKMEPFELLMSKGMYNFFIIIAVAGIFNSALLSLSVSFVSAPAITKGKVLEKAALAFSIASNMLFYLFAILVFLIKSDFVFIIPITSILCAFCGCIILIVLRIKKNNATPAL